MWRSWCLKGVGAMAFSEIKMYLYVSDSIYYPIPLLHGELIWLRRNLPGLIQINRTQMNCTKKQKEELSYSQVE